MNPKGFSALVIAASTLLAACGGGGYDISYEAARKRFVESNGLAKLSFNVECKGKEEGVANWREVWFFNDDSVWNYGASAEEGKEFDQTFENNTVGDYVPVIKKDSIVFSSKWRHFGDVLTRTEYVIDRNKGKMTAQIYEIGEDKFKRYGGDYSNVRTVSGEVGNYGFKYSCDRIKKGSYIEQPFWYVKAKETEQKNRLYQNY